MIFSLKAGDFAALRNGADVTLHVGGALPWQFGALEK